MNLLNDYTLEDFVNPYKVNIEGIIVKEKNDRDYIRIKIDLSKQLSKDYPTISLFLSNSIPNGTFCFLNCDDSITISEEKSLLLFQKCRGKLKIIFYNKTQDTISQESFFTILNWMRIIEINSSLYFGLVKNTRVLLQVKGTAKYGLKPTVFTDASQGKWEEVFSYIYFPLNEATFEDAFIKSINSDKNILTRYTEAENISFTRVDLVNEKGYSIGEIT
jgi:hypothetical protein